MIHKTPRSFLLYIDTDYDNVLIPVHASCRNYFPGNVESTTMVSRAFVESAV